MRSPENHPAQTVRTLNEALNARDRNATVSLFASGSVFRPGAAGATFEGAETITDALFGFLEMHESGRFEIVHEMVAGDEVYNEWRWSGVTNDGELFESHGCDHYLIRDGKVAVKNTFRKA
jgi:ketosteroid isomerase-like protein